MWGVPLGNEYTLTATVQPWIPRVPLTPATTNDALYRSMIGKTQFIPNNYYEYVLARKNAQGNPTAQAAYDYNYDHYTSKETMTKGWSDTVDLTTKVTAYDVSAAKMAADSASATGAGSGAGAGGVNAAGAAALKEDLIWYDASKKAPPILSGIYKEAVQSVREQGKINEQFKASDTFATLGKGFLDKLGLQMGNLNGDLATMNDLYDQAGNLVLKGYQIVNAKMVAIAAEAQRYQEQVNAFQSQYGWSPANSGGGLAVEQPWGAGTTYYPSGYWQDPAAASASMGDMGAMYPSTTISIPAESGALSNATGWMDSSGAWHSSHGGGIAGIQYFHAGSGSMLKNDEILSILQKGERIFSRADTLALDSVVQNISQINVGGSASQSNVQKNINAAFKNWGDDWIGDLKNLFKDIFGKGKDKGKDKPPITIIAPTPAARDIADIVIKQIRKNDLLKGDFYD